MKAVHMKTVQYKQKSHSGHKRDIQSLNYELHSSCIIKEADQNSLFFSFHQFYKGHFPPQHKLYFASNVYECLQCFAHLVLKNILFCYYIPTTCPWKLKHAQREY